MTDGLPPPATAPAGLSGHLPHLLLRASLAATPFLRRRLAKERMPYPYYLALLALRERPAGEKVTTLGEAMLLQQPTTTKLMDRMVRDGLATRRQGSRDRRVVVCALTERGHEAAERAAAVAAAHREEVRRRHPALFDPAVLDALASITPDTGLDRRDD